jgi:hypothetical protein
MTKPTGRPKGRPRLPAEIRQANQKERSRKYRSDHMERVANYEKLRSEKRKLVRLEKKKNKWILKVALPFKKKNKVDLNF